LQALRKKPIDASYNNEVRKNNAIILRRLTKLKIELTCLIKVTEVLLLEPP
jgi:hypothetical protein